MKLRLMFGRVIGRREILTSLFVRSIKHLNGRSENWTSELGSSKKIMQEIEKICSEETDRASQARSDELSMHHERNRTTVSQMWLKFGICRTT